MSINKNYCYFNQDNVYSYLLQRAKEVGREDDCDASSGDAASVKKVGRADAGKDLFQRKELIPNDIDPKLFGVDSS